MRVESVEVVASLTPGNLLQLLSGSQHLQPPLLLPLLSLPLQLQRLPLPHQLVPNHLTQGLQVQGDEHVEGVLLSVLGQTGELLLAELLQPESYEYIITEVMTFCKIPSERYD